MHIKFNFVTLHQTFTSSTCTKQLKHKGAKRRARCFAPSIDWTFVGPWAFSHSILVEWTWVVEVVDMLKKQQLEEAIVLNGNDY